MLKSSRSFIVNSIVLLFSVCLGLVISELLSMYIYKTNFAPRKDVNPGYWQFRFSTPLPYKDKEIYSRDFLNESMRCARDIQNRPGGYYVQGDFKGNHINIIAGIRHTTGNESTNTNSLYLFGGSTVLCPEVRDGHTSASYLQGLIDSNGHQYNVINLGAMAYTSTQQLGRLEDTIIKPGDIVVFYDGWNDVAYPVERGMPDGWEKGHDHSPEFQQVKFSDFHARIRELNLLERQITIIYLNTLDFRYQPYVIKFLYNNLYKSKYIGLGQSVDDAKTRLSNMIATYKENITKAHVHTEKQGGRFFHFLQPSVFSSAKESKYLNKIIATDLAYSRATPDIHEMGLIAQRGAVKELKGNGIESHDISDAFDDLPAGEEVFLDTVHVNHVGNKIIAERIYRVILQYH